jgi:hypothetical protein
MGGDHVAALHDEVARWLSPEGERKALQLSSAECSLVLRRVRKKAGWVACWSQVPLKQSARMDLLKSVRFQQPSPGEYWLRELERPTADAVCDLWARIGGDDASTRVEWLDDHVSGAQIVGIGLTLVGWLALTVVAVFKQLPPVYNVFECFGGYARPKTAGGAAMIVVAALALLPLAMLSQLARVFGGNHRAKSNRRT